jgi:hypothetical protein
MGEKNEPVNLIGKVKVKNENEGKKFLKLFFTGSLKEAMKYAFDNVFVPYTKDAICRTSTNVVNYWVNGDKPSSNKQAGPNRISFNDNYWSASNNRGSLPQPATKTNTVYSVSTLEFDNRGDAETVLLRLKENLDLYKQVTVADFYEISGAKFNFTDYKYGWKNLDRASVERTNYGKYYIDFPKIIPLE